MAYLTWYEQPQLAVTKALRFGSNLLFYSALDEPEIALNCNTNTTGINQLYSIYPQIAGLDPNHPIWTNHSTNVCNQSLDEWRNTLNTWNKNTATTVSGIDNYVDAAGDGFGSWTTWMKQLNSLTSSQTEKNMATLMITSAYPDRFGGRTFNDRLFNAFTAIVNGANGFLFYTDSIDWPTYRQQNDAYTQVKRVASILRDATPGILGTTTATLTVNPAHTVKTMIKQGTDGNFYIIVLNNNSDTRIVAVDQIPTGAGVIDLVTANSLTPSNSNVGVTLAPWSVKVLKITSSTVSTLTPTPTPIPTPTYISGDINRDGRVDIFDYNLLITDFGKTGNPGFTRADIDNNGKVDIFDYNILVENFGKTS